MTLAPTLSQEPNLGEVLRMIERRVARLERVSGGYANTDTGFVASLAITGLALSAQTVTPFNDSYSVYLKYTWNAISQDPNAFDKDPVVGYLTSFTTDGVNYSPEQTTTDTNTTIGGFAQGQIVTFRVRAVTKNGSKGPYAAVSNTTTADNTAPGQPSTPAVGPYLGQLKVNWNGLTSAAAPMPADFRFVEVHLSTSSATFTPTSATLKGTILRGGGDWIVTDLSYGVTYFARLVAVDQVGNRSPASTAGSGVPELLVNADVGPDAIDTANIVNLAVSNGKIANLAVNDAKIADLSVGKLTAGTLTAVVTVSGRIATATSGARVELNNAGIQAFNSVGTQTVAITTSGAATITGRFRTSFPGAGVPYLDIVDSGDRTTLYFYGTGVDYAFINSPQISGYSTLGMNSGPYPETSLANLTSRQRLWLSNTSGILLQTMQTALNTAYGGELRLNYNTARLSAIDLTNTVRSQMYLSAQLTGMYQYDAAGNDVASVYLQDEGSIGFQGFFDPDNVNGGDSALFCGYWNFGSGASSVTINYGVTMNGLMRVLYSFYSSTVSSIQKATGLSAMSSTGFTVSLASGTTASSTLIYWSFKVS